MLAVDCPVDHEPDVAAYFIDKFEKNGQLQLSVIEVDGDDISRNGVVVSNSCGASILGLIKK